MIQRPPACDRHAAQLPGKAQIVPPNQCPWCWQEDRERVAKMYSKEVPTREETRS